MLKHINFYKKGLVIIYKGCLKNVSTWRFWILQLIPWIFSVKAVSYIVFAQNEDLFICNNISFSHVMHSNSISSIYKLTLKMTKKNQRIKMFLSVM